MNGVMLAVIKWGWCQTGNMLRLRESQLAGLDLIGRRGQPNKRKMGVTELLLKDERAIHTMRSFMEHLLVESLEPFNKETADTRVWRLVF